MIRMTQCKLESGECKLSPNSIQDKTKLYCANYQSYGHPASYRGCPILLNLKKSTRKKIELQEKRERKIININNYVKKNINFANMVKNNNTTSSPAERTPAPHENTSPNAPLASSINDIINMFKTQVMTLLQKQQKQINNLTQLVEKTEKKNRLRLNIIDPMCQNNE